jgi:hypothetical protein
MAAVWVLMNAAGLQANPGSTRRLVPIGAGYEKQTLELFAGQAIDQAIAQDTDGVVQNRQVPETYASNPYNITPQERQAN